jgi:hypothetical protein
VQGHGRLAGARTALHHQGSLQVGPDDRVLLRLDRGDDVAHPAGPPSAEGRQQSSFSTQRPGGVRRVEPVQVEHLVLDSGDGATGRHQVPALHHPLGVRCGRPVERARRGSAPVGQQRRLLRVGQPDPSDVATLAVVQVEPAEGQAVLDGLQLREPVLVQGGESVPLAAVLRGAGRAGPSHRGQTVPGLGPLLVQSGVELVDHALLAGELVLTSCHLLRSCPAARGRRSGSCTGVARASIAGVDRCGRPSIIRLRRRRCTCVSAPCAAPPPAARRAVPRRTLRQTAGRRGDL